MDRQTRKREFSFLKKNKKKNFFLILLWQTQEESIGSRRAQEQQRQERGNAQGSSNKIKRRRRRWRAKGSHTHKSIWKETFPIYNDDDDNILDSYRAAPRPLCTVFQRGEKNKKKKKDHGALCWSSSHTLLSIIITQYVVILNSRVSRAVFYSILYTPRFKTFCAFFFFLCTRAHETLSWWSFLSLLCCDASRAQHLELDDLWRGSLFFFFSDKKMSCRHSHARILFFFSASGWSERSGPCCCCAAAII